MFAFLLFFSALLRARFGSGGGRLRSVGLVPHTMVTHRCTCCVHDLGIVRFQILLVWIWENRGQVSSGHCR